MHLYNINSKLIKNISLGKLHIHSLRVLVSIILLQPLFYKFTAHQDSVFIFTQVRMEPW